MATISYTRHLILGITSIEYPSITINEPDGITVNDTDVEVVILQLSDNIGCEELLPAFSVETYIIAMEDFCEPYTIAGKETLYISDPRYIKKNKTFQRG